MANDEPRDTAFRAKIKIGSIDIQFDDVVDLQVISELDAPDAVILTLGSTERVQKDVLPKLKLTDKIDVKLHFSGDEPDYAFLGELTRIEPVFSERGRQGGYTV